MPGCPIHEIAKKAGEAGIPFLVIGVILANGLDLNEPELRTTILKHGNTEIYEKLRRACADE
jgi:hypothetical protein